MRRVASRSTTTLVALAATMLIGCAPEMAQLRQSFAHPGTAAAQRARAIQHDPYVLNDVGPEVLGGRPQGYMTSVPEVPRIRQNTIPPPNLRGATPAAVAPVVIGPTPVATSPYTVQPAPGAPATYAQPAAGAPAPYAVQPAPGAVALPPAPPPVVTTPAPSTFPTQQRPPY